MKKCLFLLVMMFFLKISAQENALIKTQIKSEFLNESREIWIHLPMNYNADIAKKDQYSVVYLLDPEINWEYYVASVKYMSSQPYAKIPELIVVGIKNSNRTKDFTPTKSFKVDPYNKENKLFADSGNSDNFLSFMQKELKPLIAKQYRTLDYNIFVGHSFGGLAVMSCFYNHPEYFNAYVANDPSLWWDQSLMVNELNIIDFNQSKYDKKILYVAQANNISQEKTWNDDHNIAFRNFNKQLQKTKKVFDYQYHFYENELHGSVSMPANYDALQYIFRGFQTDVRNASDDPQKYLLKPYQKISTRLGIGLTPSLQYYNFLKVFAEKRGYKDAEDFFKSKIN